MTLRKTLARALAHTERAFADAPAGYRRRQQGKILFHVLCHPRFARDWFALLAEPPWVELCARRPRLYFKPFRVYQSTRWRPAQRRAALLDCYAFIQRHARLRASLSTPQTLASLAGATLELGYDERFRKEGELVLSLGVEGEALAAAAFGFGQEERGPVLRVGCVQGSRGRAEVAKALQKRCHGLRPAALLVQALALLAEALGCVELQGTGAAIQAHRQKHFIHLARWHRLHFDYDGFWAQQGGALGADGWFHLALPRPPRDLATVKSQKRSQQRARRGLLAELETQLRAALGAEP